MLVKTLHSAGTEGTNLVLTARKKAHGVEVQLQNRQEYTGVSEGLQQPEAEKPGRAHTTQSRAETLPHVQHAFTTLPFLPISSPITALGTDTVPLPLVIFSLVQIYFCSQPPGIGNRMVEWPLFS